MSDGPLVQKAFLRGSCGGSIGCVERMGDQEREAAIVELKERVYLKDVITDLIPVPVPKILFQSLANS